MELPSAARSRALTNRRCRKTPHHNPNQARTHQYDYHPLEARPAFLDPARRIESVSLCTLLRSRSITEYLAYGYPVSYTIPERPDANPGFPRQEKASEMFVRQARYRVNLAL